LIKIASSIALVVGATLALTACGGSGSGDKSAADAQLSSIESAVAQASAAVGSLDPSDTDFSIPGQPATPVPSDTTPDEDASNIDVCALLSPSDAIAVARADQLDPAQTAKSVYTLTRTKEEASQENSSACRFDITDTAQEATVLFQVEAGSHIDIYNLGTKDPGLGDEAYTNENGGSVVRVGGLMITEGDDTFDSKTTLDLLSKMAPNLH
jgi:hypothetical protein